MNSLHNFDNALGVLLMIFKMGFKTIFQKLKNINNKDMVFKRILLLFLLGVSIFLFSQTKPIVPWSNGKLMVSKNNRYLQHENGNPFFWLGETGWLLPERADRDEVDFYLNTCAQNGYNVVQVQTINNVPAINKYGQSSMPNGFDFSVFQKKEGYSYWDHMDYIIKSAEKQGIYIGMVCIWGGLVKSGLMNKEQAKSYGTFLAERYKNSPNIIWMIGGDIKGNVATEVWETLAKSIKAIDKNHLMTFHPFGRTSSANWFNQADWLDFNMFQSGHRRYGQQKGDGDFSDIPNTEEDNWRYPEKAFTLHPIKPILDGEPSYEGIPQGLHDPKEPRWKAQDVRRYAYWSVFAGAFGHTYGNNSIMQFYRPGLAPAYGAEKPWYNALEDEGFKQMKYLKKLMLSFPFAERVPDQKIIKGKNGERYERMIATRGTDYLLVYNYSGLAMQIDLSTIIGNKKKCWWYHPKDGTYQFIGEFEGNRTVELKPGVSINSGEDRVLVAVDSSKEYIKD